MHLATKLLFNYTKGAQSLLSVISSFSLPNTGKPHTADVAQRKAGKQFRNTAAMPPPKPAANSRSTRGSSQHRHRQKAASAAACRVRPFSGRGRYSVRASAARSSNAAISCQTAAVGCTGASWNCSP